MPLCHGNSGKYLSKRFAELRVQAYNDESLLSDNEKDFAETSNMTMKDMNKSGMWEVETQPMAWYDSPGGKLIDIRTIIDPTFEDEKKRK